MLGDPCNCIFQVSGIESKLGCGSFKFRRINLRNASSYNLLSKLFQFELSCFGRLVRIVTQRALRDQRLDMLVYYLLTQFDEIVLN